jgi:hypothetical protein
MVPAILEEVVCAGRIGGIRGRCTPTQSPFGSGTCSIGMALAVRSRSGTIAVRAALAETWKTTSLGLYAAIAIVASLLGTDREDSE